LSYKIIGAAREVYKELGPGYNVEKSILIIQCNSVKIRGELLLLYLFVLRSAMLTGFEKIVEERIRQAQKKGEFDNLPGSGKPLKFEDNCYIMEELRLAYKILKNADCIPPEIELKKEINRMEDLLFKMDDTAEKYSAIKKLNFLIMKLNSFRNTSIRYEIPQRYMSEVIERIGSKR